MALVLAKNLLICFSWFGVARIYFPASLRSRWVWFPPVSTTMKALTPQLSASQVCGTAEVSLLISIELPNIPSPTTLLPFHRNRFVTLPEFAHRCDLPHRPPGVLPADLRSSLGRLRAVKGSCFTRTLPDRLGRIEFTYVTDCSFTSGCSPPFLMETQLPLSVTGR